MGAQEVKTALKKGLLCDFFTNSLYAFAPYRGCAHGCRYCDGRAEKYYVEGDFEKDIVVRTNLPDVLQRELASVRERSFQGQRCFISVGSGVTDVYQPQERLGLLMRRCAEVVAEKDFPVVLMTKSSLVQRDLDLWKKVNQGTRFVLLMSIALDDEAHRRRFEPGASPLKERWETLKMFKEAGCATGVLAMPLLPQVSDDEKTLRSIYTQAVQAGVDFVMPGGLTLRPGRQKDAYWQTLAQVCPQALPVYEHLYQENRPSGAPLRSASQALELLHRRLGREFALPFLLPHRVYGSLIPPYEALFLLMVQMEMIFADRPAELPRLRSARQAFGRWLGEKRSAFRRHRTLEPTWISSQFNTLIAGEGWGRVLDNPRLEAFTRQVLTGSVFDSLGRRLEGRAPGLEG